MKHLLFSLLCLAFLLGSTQVHAQNPYKEFGIEIEPLTLSKGKYNEFFTNDSLVRIGSVILDTRNNRIARFVVVDTAYSEATLEPELTVRFLQPDPYAADYPNLSPYSYVANNPLLYTDPTGKYIVDSNGNRVEVTTTQDEDGNYINSYTFAEGTEQSVIDDFHANGGVILGAMAMTEEGRSQIGNLTSAEHSISMILSEEDLSTSGGATLGGTLPKFKQNEDGSFSVESAEITVYKGSIESLVNLERGTGTLGFMQLAGVEGVIGMTGVHESVHATDPVNLKKNYENRYFGRRHDLETVPTNIGKRHLYQFLFRNN